MYKFEYFYNISVFAVLVCVPFFLYLLYSTEDCDVYIFEPMQSFIKICCLISMLHMYVLPVFSFVPFCAWRQTCPNQPFPSLIVIICSHCLVSSNGVKYRGSINAAVFAISSFFKPLHFAFVGLMGKSISNFYRKFQFFTSLLTSIGTSFVLETIIFFIFRLKHKLFSNLFIGGSSNGSEQLCLKDKDPLKSGGSSASESDMMRTHGHGSGRRSGGSRSRSSGSEQSVATTTMTPPQQGSSVASGPTATGNANAEDVAGSRQSFRIAMGNPCEFFVDVM